MRRLCATSRTTRRTVCTALIHFTFPNRIGTNFGEPSRDQRSCISSLDIPPSLRDRQKWEIRIERICKESKREKGGEDRAILDSLGVAQWDSSGARTNAIYPPSVQVGFDVRPTEGRWVGGWVGGERRSLPWRKEKQAGFKRRGSEGRREKQDGGGRGKARQRDVFLKTKIWLCQCL